MKDEASKESEAAELVDTLVDEVRYWMTRDLPVSVLRALRRHELDALRKRLARVVRGDTPLGEERVIEDTGAEQDE
jgi:hypothetical protein